MSKESFLVTGAAGFIGACLVRRLLADRKDVHILIKPDSNPWRLQGTLKHVSVFKGNLTDIKTVSRVVKKVKPTVIYHLAAHGAYSFQKDAERIIKTNILGTWNLLKACDDIDYKVFVNTGSSSEYGAKSVSMKETDLLEPNSYYAVAKSAQTLLCQHVARLQKRPISTFRLFSVYGPYEELSRLIPTLMHSCLTGKELRMVAPQTARDFIFVDDVVDAYLCLGNLSKLSGDVINIGTGKQKTLKDAVDCVLKMTAMPVNVRWGKMPARIWDASNWVADTTKCKMLLGWRAKVSLEEGFQKTWQWFKNNKSLLTSRQYLCH